MDEKTAYDTLPVRLQYYLLDFRDNNLDKLDDMFKNTSLRKFSEEQLHKFIMYAIGSDLSNNQ